ncbi:MAG: LysR family transcriptional regulator [Deltaproteobacteria bacterium]|nr:LysR family transcriptional regulator [Deltaproteobacteria bacterium]
MINFNQLRAFYETARCLSCTEAAQRLCVTQPAVTAHLKLFEDFCDLKLFKKRGRRIHLTDEGQTLFEYAGKIFEFESEIEDTIEDLRELKRGVLRLGTTKTYARYFMPFLIGDFRKTYPHILIHLDEGSSLDMIQSLLEFKNQVAIVAKAIDHPDVTFIPFSQEKLVLILSPDHRLLRKKRVSLEDVADEPVIMKEIGSGTRRRVNELFAEHDISPNVLMDTGNTEFIKQLVQRGDGISFLVMEAVKVELEEGKLATRAIKGRQLMLDVSIAYLKNQHLSPPAMAFLDILGTLAPADMSPQGIGALMSKMLARRK